MITSITATHAHAQEIRLQEASLEAETCSPNNPSITFKPQTIFDKNEEGFIFIHRWANAIHVDTKQFTLENESAFFLNKCKKTIADMAELERHLRNRKYLRDAKVTNDEKLNNITVTTWDNWSLLPTIGFGRQGGESTYSFGIKERNLLGLGVDAEIATYRNSQRKGYKIKSVIPMFSQKNIDLALNFADNDDGTQQSMFLHKNFASFYTQNSYLVGFNEESRNDTIYQNSKELAVFSHNISYKNAEYGWLHFNNKDSLLRYRFGVTEDHHKFSYADNVNDNPDSILLPRDRDFIYPWIGVDYIEKDFRKLTNIHLITQIEDFNHGWQFSSKLGLSDGKKDNSAWALFQAKIHKGYEVHKNALVLLDVRLSGDIYHQRENRFLLNINTEYFYNFNKNWGYYFNNNNIISNNQYLDDLVNVGGSTGLRGFPLEYQHGEHSIKFTNEIRFYPYINWFKLFDIAGAAFFDAAKTYGKIEALGMEANDEEGWLYSVGLGARLYSPHSSGSQQVIHVDLAFPQSDNPNIDTYEIRVEAKQSF